MRSKTADVTTKARTIEPLRNNASSLNQSAGSGIAHRNNFTPATTASRPPRQKRT
ncbi:hypothetical protein I6E81_10540 [Salinibacterium sp. NG22]|uniref:hypothetical protein n=1 Tax=Salinibacterium sp. NG22 TaxID=2792040 RepID=UPI0018CCAD88|nr:hypothetical protein [Salinibacterium sp. NG22]MBH0110605.1 hypothetical protein [Salinibacterium sp. NG22]